MGIETSQLLLLLNWMSPTFPIGSFAYSHGLEQAIADGRWKIANEVESWITDLLQHGSGWNDAVIFAQCWQCDNETLNDTALALAGSHERFLETTQLGRAFNIAASVWTGNTPHEGLTSYPVAAGTACKQLGIPRHDALAAFLQGFASALVSVAVRLVPLGQTKGLEILRNLSPTIAAIATKAGIAGMDDLGGSCIVADIAAMQHETLQPRIFRT